MRTACSQRIGGGCCFLCERRAGKAALRTEKKLWLCIQERNRGFSDGRKIYGFAYRKEIAGFRSKNGDFLVVKKATDFRTEKGTATLRTGKKLQFCRRRKMWLCGREGDGNFRTEKETVALRTGRGREFSDRERNGSFADDGRNGGFAGTRGEQVCSFADSPDCIY